MSVTLETSHFEMSLSNDPAPENMKLMSVTLETSHFERSLLKDFAKWNIPDMSLTFDTSHFEMSPRNNFASENMRLMSVTFDTSHSPIGPCGPLEQSPSGHKSRHVLAAKLSSAPLCGTHPGVARCVCVGVRGGGGKAIGLNPKQDDRSGASASVKI